MTESTSARRRSGRSAAKQSYAERDSDEDNEEMLGGVQEWRYDGPNDKREVASLASQPADEVDEAESEDDDIGDDADTLVSPLRSVTRRTRTTTMASRPRTHSHTGQEAALAKGARKRVMTAKRSTRVRDMDEGDNQGRGTDQKRKG
jgi:hypothetical protein